MEFATLYTVELSQLPNGSDPKKKEELDWLSFWGVLTSSDHLYSFAASYAVTFLENEVSWI